MSLADFDPETLGMYVLDGHTPRLARSRTEWTNFYEHTQNRRVAWTDLGHVGFVSTTFLAIAQFNQHDGPPLLFETRARIGKDYSEDVTRLYSTWHDAIAGHADLVAEHRAIHKAVTKLKSVTGRVTNLKPIK